MADSVIDAVTIWIQSETGKTIGYGAIMAIAWAEAAAIESLVA